METPELTKDGLRRPLPFSLDHFIASSRFMLRQHLTGLANAGTAFLARDTALQAFLLKITDVTMVKKIKNAPSWLGLSPDRSSFVYDPERAEILRQIFQLSIGGFGGTAIARLLNKKKIPGFGSSKKWDQSTVHNMLTNRATVGEYQRKQTIDGKEKIVGEPVPNYYPAVIDLATFEAVQVARRRNIAHRSGRRGKVITNLFFGLASCSYCSQAMKFNSNGAQKSLVCTSVLTGRGRCPRFAWSYQDFESLFFASIAVAARYPEFSEILQTLQNAVKQTSEAGLLEARMRMATFLKGSISSLTIAVAGAEPPPPKTHLIIRRDHPSRFFEVKFSDNFCIVGIPHPREPAGQKIAPIEFTKYFGLSPRQAEIVSLLVQGFSLKQAAEKLGQTFETGRWHLREIFHRTGAHSQPELINLAKQSLKQD